jgi:hypothetical protein
MMEELYIGSTPEQLAFLKAWEEKVVFISHS